MSPAELELFIVYRSVAELIPYARNARTHSEAQVAQIAGSIKEFGFLIPVLVDGASGIIAGHGRVLAARKLGMEKVPTIEAAHLSEAQRRAYVLADNKLALNAGWDDALLKIELADLRELSFDLDLLGFAPPELDELLGRASNPPGGGGSVIGGQNNGGLAARFGVPPFSVLNAREGWWQDRKRAWIALGIQSELGRGELADDANATPGGSPMPAARLEGGKTVRGDGRGRKANAIPGGAPMPLDRRANGPG
jgi:ParB-like nuclease domain